MSSVLSEHKGPIGYITLNRPDKRNALSPELLADLKSALTSMESNPAIRVVVLQGEGKVFSAGADLAYLEQLADYSILENLRDSQNLRDVLQTIVQLRLPVIAKVHGPAIAGGCGLASVCDFVVASRSLAKFGYSEVKIGFIPALVAVYLVRKIGESMARRLLLSADVIDAEYALRLGLVTDVVEHEVIDSYTHELAVRLAENSRDSVALTKELLYSISGMSLESGLAHAATMNALTRMTEDCKTGIASFLRK